MISAAAATAASQLQLTRVFANTHTRAIKWILEFGVIQLANGIQHVIFCCIVHQSDPAIAGIENLESGMREIMCAYVCLGHYVCVGHIACLSHVIFEILPGT